MEDNKDSKVSARLTGGEAGDRDFEPSAELLVHDYDDEATMEEEENLSSESGDSEEVDDLEKVKYLLSFISQWTARLYVL